MLARIESAFGARVASERRLRDSEARLRRFVADASHELRTPIAAISAYAELFGRGASEQKEDLERLMGGIRNETGRMEHLVADLLLLARLDEGRPMERRSGRPGRAVRRGGAHRIDRRTRLAGDLRTPPGPIEVMGDATSLRQVVDNLLGNVRAHTPAGTDGPGLGGAGRQRCRGRRWPTTARAWTPSRRTTSSSGSTAPTRAGPGSTAGPGSGSPS